MKNLLLAAVLTAAPASARAQSALKELKASAPQDGGAAAVPAAAPAPLSAAPARLTCLQEAQTPRNDPLGERKDFVALGRCRSVLSWTDAEAHLGSARVVQWDADVCLGRYTDPRDGAKVYLVWGDVSGYYDQSKRDGILLAPRFAVAEGKNRRTTPQGREITETAKETGDQIRLTKLDIVPSSGGDPNKAGNSHFGRLTFSKGAMTLEYATRIKSNWPFGLLASWSDPSTLVLSCARE